MPVAIIKLGTLARLPASSWRKVGTTSSHHAPYVLGFTRATMAGTTSCHLVKGSESLKLILSSDRSLQLDCVKSESLVTVDQHAAVNTFPGLVHTARQAMEAGGARRQCANPDLSGRQLPKAKLVTGAKS